MTRTGQKASEEFSGQTEFLDMASWLQFTREQNQPCLHLLGCGTTDSGHLVSSIALETRQSASRQGDAEKEKATVNKFQPLG